MKYDKETKIQLIILTKIFVLLGFCILTYTSGEDPKTAKPKPLDPSAEPFVPSGTRGSQALEFQDPESPEQGALGSPLAPTASPPDSPLAPTLSPPSPPESPQKEEIDEKFVFKGLGSLGDE